MPEDSLNAKKMNVNPGGAQPLMRPGWFKIGPMKMVQHMVFQSGPQTGTAKGLKVVCRERFGDESVNGELEMDNKKQVMQPEPCQTKAKGLVYHIKPSLSQLILSTVPLEWKFIHSEL